MRRRDAAINLRIVYTGDDSPAYKGKTGVITGTSTPSRSPDGGVIVRFDHDLRERVIMLSNLSPAEKHAMNFKVAVKTAVDALIAAVTGESVKDAAVRKLGVGMELVSKGESIKKKAKEDLLTLGVIQSSYAASSEETVFDSESYTMVAKTNAGSQRLDQSKLSAAMHGEGISVAKINRIIAAATVDSKPATSFKIEAK